MYPKQHNRVKTGTQVSPPQVQPKDPSCEEQLFSHRLFSIYTASSMVKEGSAQLRPSPSWGKEVLKKNWRMAGTRALTYVEIPVGLTHSLCQLCTTHVMFLNRTSPSSSFPFPLSFRWMNSRVIWMGLIQSAESLTKTKRPASLSKGGFSSRLSWDCNCTHSSESRISSLGFLACHSHCRFWTS